jgi:hypothetical protein
MSLAQTVYKKQVLQPVSFKRAVTGLPVIDAPDIDDRGSVSPDFYPVVGITQGDIVKVKIKREALENSSNAKLFLTSSDTAVMKVESPASGPIPAGDEVEIKIKGVSGGATATPKKAKLEVRYGAASGTILNKLDCWVFQEAQIRLAPHLVTIRGTVPACDVDAVMALVRAIWRPCGVSFAVDATRNDSITSFANAGVVMNPWVDPNAFSGSELDRLLSTNRANNKVNIYFVNQIGTSGGTLGYGFSRAAHANYGIANPGIVLAATTPGGGTTRDDYYWANDLAHEIGHFLRLWHPNQQEPPDEREDSWSRRMLMHNYNKMRDTTWPRVFAAGPPVRNYANRASFNDLGYGAQLRGGFITMKDLSQISTDGECGTSRGAATGPANQLY